MVGKESRHKYTEFLIQKKDKLLLGLIFVIGIVLRFLWIDSRDIAYDDAFSYFLARSDLLTIISGTLADTMPPLYYFLLHFWIKISSNLWYLRLLNILINLFTAILVYKLAKQLFSGKTASIAFLLFLISPFQIYHSQELRMYSLLLMGQVGFFYAIFKTINLENKNYNLWILMAVFFGTVSVYAHNLGFFGLLSINIILFFKRGKSLFIKLLIPQLFILLLSTPWLFFLPQQINKVQQAFWTVEPGLIDIIQGLLTLFSFLPMPIIFMGIVLIIIIQSLIITVVYLFRIKNKNYCIVFLFFIFPPILLFIMSYLIQPVFVPRIFISSAVWFFLLISSFIAESWNKGIGKLNLVLFIFISCISLPIFYKFNDFPRSPFKELSGFIQTEYNNSTPIIHDNKLSFFPVMFHSETENQYYLMDIQGSPNDTLAYKSQLALGYTAMENIEKFLNEDTLVFITFQKTLDEYQSLGVTHPILKILGERYKQEINKIVIGDLIVFSYGDK
jgi:hypothetical protein